MRGLIEALIVWAGPPTFTWFGTPPTEPHEPFGSPALIVYDSLRMVCFAAGAVSIIYAAVLMRRPHGAVGQWIRLLAQTGGVIYAIMTEAYRFGDYANMRLILALIVTVGAAWGNYLGVRYEDPPPLRWRPQSVA